MSSIFRLDLSRDRAIARLAAPIVGGMISQTLLNLVDTAMVGRLDADALAAVGLGSTATWLSVSVLLGIGSATQALVARRIGEGRPMDAGKVLDNALAMGLSAGVLIAAAVYLLAPTLFSFLTTSPRVAQLGTEYLTMRTIGFPFVVMNFAFRGFYHGVGDTRTYLKAIILTNVVNGVLDFVLIFGIYPFPRMEVAGAGLGTALGLASGTAYYLLRAAPRTGLRRRFGAMRLWQVSRETCRSLASITVPNGLQGLGTALGFMGFYWLMARLSTEAVAVTNLMMNISSAFYLPAMGMGLAAATLVGQALGRGDPDDAEAWGWETVRLAVYFFTVAGALVAVAPGPALRVFTNDPQVIEAGKMALRMVGLSQCAMASGMVLSNVLISAGSARFVMVVNVGFVFVLVLPVVYLVCVVYGVGGVALAWLIMGLGRLAMSGAMGVRFGQGRWKASTL